MSPRRKPTGYVPPPVAPEYKPDAYEEGMLAGLQLLKDYCSEATAPLRLLDAGIASGLLQPVANILGALLSAVEHRAMKALGDRRKAMRAEQSAAQGVES